MTKDEALIFVKRDTDIDTFNQLSWGTKVAMSVLSDTIAEQDTTIAQLQAEIGRLTSLEFNVTTDNIILYGEIAALKAGSVNLREILGDVHLQADYYHMDNGYAIRDRIDEALGETK